MRNHFSKKLGLSLAVFGIATTGMFMGQDAEAMPGFARQTGMPCNACHFQTFPALSAMGRGFKMDGYTMEGSQASIEGENALKLPDTLNIGGVIKIRHNKAGGDFTKTGDEADFGRLDFPDEAALLVGGRLSANSGFLWEFAVKAETNLLGAKYVFNAAKAGDIQFQVIPYSTDGQGTGYGQELMNNATVGLQRIAEDKTYSAPVQLGFVSAAAGLNLVAQSSNWAFNYNMFAPVFPGEHKGEVAMNITGLATYMRGVYFMDLAGFDTGVGFGQYSGTVKTMGNDTTSGTTKQTLAKDSSGNDTTTVLSEATTYSKHKEVYLAPTGSFVDFQMQGEIAGMQTGFYFSTGSVPEAGKAADTTYSYAAAKAKSATGMAVKVGVTPELFVTFQNGSRAEGDVQSDGKTAMTHAGSSLGLQYMISQNVKFEFTNKSDAPSEGKSTSLQQMMLFIGM